MRRLSNWLYQVSTGRVAMIAVITFVLFSALVLPRQAAQAEQTSGGAGSPDSSFVYSTADLYEFAEAYGEAGRAAYVRARFTFDVVFPLVYTFFLATAISWVFGRAFAADSVWRLANLAPILGMAFDFLENVSTSLVMLRFPAPTPLVAQLAPLFTSIKWLFVNGSFVILLIGLITLAVVRLRSPGE